VTIYGVAPRAGVSIATVSRVLRRSAPVRDATRERVQATVDEQQWSALEAADRLEKLEPASDLAVERGTVELAFDLPMPSVSLVELVPR
jgi:Bacterial regulatory proteins, lacI family